MNYYNPYFGLYPAAVPARTGFLRSLFSGGRFSLSSLMSGTQRTLNLINQAIPVIKQVSPVMKNAKTMFKVMNEFKKTDTPSKEKKTNTSSPKENISETKETSQENIYEENNGPTFFM